MKHISTAIILFFIFLFFKPILIPMITQQNITIKKLIKNNQYNKAKYIFKWGNVKKILIDDFKKINMIYGYKKDNTSVKIINNVLIVEINNNGAILKTEKDSVDIEKDCSKAKGYMGIFTTSNQFKTTENGEINIINDEPCR